ncbi:MAG: glycoside hydrolase family 3 N-terminal domain-containing protein [Gemmatimonadales bacterium]|nr:glycoside hydrolase family 3 N-terminal domain-containing protein [Gemmatimonadales bacterium]
MMGRMVLLALAAALPLAGQRPAYQDPALPSARRAQDLLARMTIEEKFGQLYMLPGDLAPDSSRFRHGLFGLQVAARGDRNDAAAQLLQRDPSGSAGEVARRINATQRWFLERTRLGIPIIPFEEALHGLVQQGATVYPQAIGLAATWDTALMGRVAAQIAQDARTRGVRQILSPVLNVVTDVRWGRVEETYGEDPWLAARLGVAFVRAFESAGVITTPKHFVSNVGDGGRDSYPTHFDQRYLDDVIFPPFRAAFEAGARSVMASYNSVHGEPATANRWLLTETLRAAWGFTGFVIADAGGTGGANVLHFTAADYPDATRRAITAGLDVIFQTSWEHAPLFRPAFLDGSIPPAVIDSAVVRVLRAKFELGLFDDPYVDVAAAERTASAPASRALATEAARASITLLRNQHHTLPLDRTTLRSLLVIGPDAVEARFGGYSGSGNAPITILDGLRAIAGTGVRVHHLPGPGRTGDSVVTVPSSALRTRDGAPGLDGEYFDNIRLEGAPRVVRRDAQVGFGWTLFAPDTALAWDWYSVRWTGTLVAPATGYLQLGVEGNDGYRLWLDDSLLIDQSARASYGRQLRRVSVTAGRSYRVRLEYVESSGNGRIRLIWSEGINPGLPMAKVVEAAAEARRADAVVIVVGIEEGEFQDRASLALPGLQETLIRAVAATGRPVTVVVVGGSAVTMREWVDKVGAIVNVWYPGETGGTAVAEVLFGDVNPAGRLPFTVPMTEGQLPLPYLHLPTGRGDDYADLTGQPLFPFGHGLSYTTFDYSGLEIAPLGRERFEVRATIRNSGARAGDEVVQLYLRDELASVAQPIVALQGFQRIHLAPGATRVVRFLLDSTHLALTDTLGRRIVEPGHFRVMLGASSKDLRLRGRFEVR